MNANKTNSLYRAYLDGQTMYSNGTPAPATLTAEGWEVQPTRQASAHEKMVGAAMMRRAVVGMIEAGRALNGEVARDLAHWLTALNDGRAAGVFVPLALAADGAPAVIDAATDDHILARHEIAKALTASGTVPVRYRSALIDSLNRADRGRLAGLAAPGAERIVDSSEAPERAKAPAFRPRIGWQIALFDAWVAICEKHKHAPTTTEAIKWLKENDSSGYILNSYTGAGIRWKPQRGIAKDVDYKTVENVISSWRVRGVLPS